MFSLLHASLYSLSLFSRWELPSAPALAGLFWVSLSNVVLAYFLWFEVLKRCSSALVASLAFITPFVTLLFIAALLGETISWAHIGGLAVMLLGVAVQGRKGSRQLSG